MEMPFFTWLEISLFRPTIDKMKDFSSFSLPIGRENLFIISFNLEKEYLSIVSCDKMKTWRGMKGAKEI